MKLLPIWKTITMQTTGNNSGNNQKVSVVLTVLNEGKSIRGVLDNLLKQSRKPDEIVICDGGSTDDTVKQMEEIASEEMTLKVVLEGSACRGKGRNTAIRKAAGPIIALTDAGTIADRKWLENLLSPCLENPSLRVVYGTVMPNLNGRLSKPLAALIIGNLHINGRLCPSVASLLFYKNAWEEVGGFPEGLTTLEDLIFLKRLKEGKIPFTYAPEAVVHWSLPDSLTAVFRRFTLYSQGSLTAGFAQRWHYGTARNLVVFVILIWLGLTSSSWFLPFLLFFHLLRVHRYCRTIPWIKNQKLSAKISCYCQSGVILLILDLATLNGFLLWLLKDKCLRKEITKISCA